MSDQLDHFTSIFDKARSARVSGDKEEAEALWEDIRTKLPPVIWPVARGFGLSREQAEKDFIPDLLGTLFLVIERFKRQPGQKGRAWVKRIAFHMLVNRTRVLRKERLLPEDAWDSVLAVVAGKQGQEQLSESEVELNLRDAEECLRKHPPEGNAKIAAVYDLITNQGKSQGEVAVELGLAPSSIAVYLSKALTALRDLLVDKE